MNIIVREFYNLKKKHLMHSCYYSNQSFTFCKNAQMRTLRDPAKKIVFASFTILNI